MECTQGVAVLGMRVMGESKVGSELGSILRGAADYIIVYYV